MRHSIVAFCVVLPLIWVAPAFAQVPPKWVADSICENSSDDAVCRAHLTLDPGDGSSEGDSPRLHHCEYITPTKRWDFADECYSTWRVSAFTTTRIFVVRNGARVSITFVVADNDFGRSGDILFNSEKARSVDMPGKECFEAIATKETFCIGQSATRDILNPDLDNNPILVDFPFSSEIKAETKRDRNTAEGFAHRSWRREAVDIAAPIHSPVRSVSDGEVIFVENRTIDSTEEASKVLECNNSKLAQSIDPSVGHGCMGNFITIKHRVGSREFFVSYLHFEQNSFLKSVGDRVRAGEVIGRVGYTGLRTGAHLHIQAGETTVPDAMLTTKVFRGNIADASKRITALVEFRPAKSIEEIETALLAEHLFPREFIGVWESLSENCLKSHNLRKYGQYASIDTSSGRNVVIYLGYYEAESGKCELQSWAMRGKGILAKAECSEEEFSSDTEELYLDRVENPPRLLIWNLTWGNASSFIKCE